MTQRCKSLPSVWLGPKSKSSPLFPPTKHAMVPQHGPFSLHTMLEGPWLHKTTFPTPMVRPLDESQVPSPLQGHGSWFMCEVATSHTSQEPWPWNRESPKESVQRPSLDTPKSCSVVTDPRVYVVWSHMWPDLQPNAISMNFYSCEIHAR